MQRDRNTSADKHGNAAKKMLQPSIYDQRRAAIPRGWSFRRRQTEKNDRKFRKNGFAGQASAKVEVTRQKSPYFFAVYQNARFIRRILDCQVIQI